MRTGRIFYYSGSKIIEEDDSDCSSLENDESHKPVIKDKDSHRAIIDISSSDDDDKQPTHIRYSTSEDSVSFCECNFGGDSEVEGTVLFDHTENWFVKLTFAVPDARPHALFLEAKHIAELGRVSIDDDVVYKLGHGKEPTSDMRLNNNHFAYLTLSPNNENVYIHCANNEPCTILRHAYEPSKLQDVRCAQVIDQDILVFPVFTGPGDMYRARIRVDFRGARHDGGFMNQLLYLDWRNDSVMSFREIGAQRTGAWLHEVRKNLVAEQVDKMPSGLEEEEESKPDIGNVSYSLFPTGLEPVVPALPHAWGMLSGPYSTYRQPFYLPCPSTEVVHNGNNSSRQPERFTHRCSLPPGMCSAGCSPPANDVTTPVVEPSSTSEVTEDEDDEIPEAGPSSCPALPTTHSYRKRARFEDLDDFTIGEVHDNKRQRSSGSSILGSIGIVAMGAVVGSMGTLWGLLAMDGDERVEDV